jgi:hypothetical protein
MSTNILTAELKQMNAYWRLLAFFVGSIRTILLDPQLAPEQRLERIREELERVQPYMQNMPPTVRAELHAKPAVQAVLADVAQRLKQVPSGGDRPYYVMREDGELHEVTDILEPGARPLSDREILALLQEDGEA